MKTINTIKFSIEETVKTLYYGYGFRTVTTREQINELVNLLLNMAVSARAKGKIEYSNKLIFFAVSVKNCYVCSSQAPKKARKTFLIEDFKEG